MPTAPDGRSLSHSFLPGLRIDTKVQFLARSTLGRRSWRVLPMPQTSASGSGWAALMQVEALTTGRASPRAALRRALRVGAAPLTPGDLLVRLRELAPALSLRWYSGQATLARQGELDEAWSSPVLACLAGPQGTSWALVSGKEEVQGGGGVPRALLLLDPRLPAPWGTGYNARLVLAEGLWRGLDGEVERVELLGLAVMARR